MKVRAHIKTGAGLVPQDVDVSQTVDQFLDTLSKNTEYQAFRVIDQHGEARSAIVIRAADVAFWQFPIE